MLPQASPVNKEDCRLSKYLMAGSKLSFEGARGEDVKPSREEGRTSGVKGDEGLGKGAARCNLRA